MEKQKPNPSDDEIKEITMNMRLIEGYEKIESNDFKIETLSVGVASTVYKIIFDEKCFVYKHHNLIPSITEERRNRENHFIDLLSKNGLIQKCYLKGVNFRIEEYLESRDIKSFEINDPVIRKRLSYNLGRVHSIKDSSIDKTEFLEEIYKNSAIMDGFKKNLDPELYKNLEHKELVKSCEKFLSEEVRYDIRNLTKDYLKVLSHNDIWCGNILLLKNNTNAFYIDYQMVAYNFRGYDLGKLILETMYLRDESGRNYIFTENLFPKKDEIEEFLTYYYLGFNNFTFEGLNDNVKYDNSDVKKFIDDFNQELEIGMMTAGYYTTILGLCFAFEKSFGLDFIQFAEDGYKTYVKYREKLKC